MIVFKQKRNKNNAKATSFNEVVILK